MKKPSQKFFVKILLFALVSLSVASCKCEQNKSSPTADGKEPILIGEVVSATGSEATFGMSQRNAVALALEDLNSKGGINGRPVKIISLDNQSKPEESATAITKLITQEKVVAVLGEIASSRSLAMAPIAQSNGIPMISPGSTNPKVTDVGDFIFRICFIDPFQGTVMAKFADETLKVKKVAVLRDVKNDYSVGLADYFTETFKKSGGEVLVDISYNSGDVDFKSQLTSIKAKNPEAVYLPGYYTDIALIMRQARDLNINVPFMGGDGWDSPKLFEIGGTSVNGSYLSNHYSTDDTAPMVQDFISRYKAKYGEVPDALAALGYDAALILFDVLKKIPNVTPTAIRDELKNVRGFQGVTGNITIDEKRNAHKSAVVLKIENGKFVYQTTVQPG